MGRENEPVHSKRVPACRLGKTPQAIINQPVKAAREKGGEVVPRIPQPIAARQQGDGRTAAAGEIKPAAWYLLGERHGTALLRKTVQMDDDVDRGGCARDRVPPQKQIGLGPGMRRQHWRVTEISLARHRVLASRDDWQLVHSVLRRLWDPYFGHRKPINCIRRTSLDKLQTPLEVAGLDRPSEGVDHQPRGRPAGLPDRPLANRPRRSCSACFIRSRSGIANSAAIVAASANEIMPPTSAEVTAFVAAAIVLVLTHQSSASSWSDGRGIPQPL